jgi:SAM-dependent methyltransferase
MKLKLAVDRLAYTLEDQALMARAENYFAWQARLIEPELGRRVVEIGCGTGNFTRTLLDREAVIAVDIESACVQRLLMRFPAQPNLYTAVCSPDDDSFRDLARFHPDCCVCLNVLEHIEHDVEAVRKMGAILPRGGLIVLLLPAFPALYGPIDRNLGHHRRYTSGSVARVAQETGLELEKLRYMNVAGFFAWWANARIFRRVAQSARQIAAFDRFVVPVMAHVESVIPPPFGQSLIAVLKKS